MSPREHCTHDNARFHSIQRLGTLPPVELWHCPDCNGTFSAQTLEKESKSVAAA